MRNGDRPCGEWLLTGVTRPGSWFGSGGVTKNVQKDRAEGVHRAVSSAWSRMLRQGCQDVRVFRERREHGAGAAQEDLSPTRVTEGSAP
ncbi:hypothetical protein GCM10019016_136630 [Streptomyces prasinosporus]|uniref:Uncharacterized protein n=1 Tax=Streptomyces prasinosporus TaxID=68256 RepID=A0ABP6UIJ0_9ACTN